MIASFVKKILTVLGPAALLLSLGGCSGLAQAYDEASTSHEVTETKDANGNVISKSHTKSQKSGVEQTQDWVATGNDALGIWTKIKKLKK